MLYSIYTHIFPLDFTFFRKTFQRKNYDCIFSEEFQNRNIVKI